MFLESRGEGNERATEAAETPDLFDMRVSCRSTLRHGEKRVLPPASSTCTQVGEIRMTKRRELCSRRRSLLHERYSFLHRHFLDVSV